MLKVSYEDPKPQHIKNQLPRSDVKSQMAEQRERNGRYCFNASDTINCILFLQTIYADSETVNFLCSVLSAVLCFL